MSVGWLKMMVLCMCHIYLKISVENLLEKNKTKNIILKNLKPVCLTELSHFQC